MYNITLCVLSLRFCLSLGLFFMSDTIIYVTRVFCLYWLWCCIISHLISILCSTGECLHSHDLIWQLYVVILLFLYSTYIVMICTISLIRFFFTFYVNCFLSAITDKSFIRSRNCLPLPSPRDYSRFLGVVHITYLFSFLCCDLLLYLFIYFILFSSCFLLVQCCHSFLITHSVFSNVYFFIICFVFLIFW
jgi:hypothetical protein